MQIRPFVVYVTNYYKHLIFSTFSIDFCGLFDIILNGLKEVLALSETTRGNNGRKAIWSITDTRNIFWEI